MLAATVNVSGVTGVQPLTSVSPSQQSSHMFTHLSGLDGHIDPHLSLSVSLKSSEWKDLNHISIPEGFQLTRWHFPASQLSFHILCVSDASLIKMLHYSYRSTIWFCCNFSAGSNIKLTTFTHPQFHLHGVTLTKDRNTGGDSPQSLEWGKQAVPGN